MRATSLTLALLLLFTSANAATAGSQTAGVGLELNRLEPLDGACRAYVVLQNDTASTFRTFRYDLVVFDADGIVTRRLALETAPLSAGKTSLKVFDLADLACEGIGRILVNDILECADQSGGRTDCLALVRPSTRSDVSLIK